jgi:hypothetical protein
MSVQEELLAPSMERALDGASLPLFTKIVPDDFVCRAGARALNRHRRFLNTFDCHPPGRVSLPSCTGTGQHHAPIFTLFR